LVLRVRIDRPSGLLALVGGAIGLGIGLVAAGIIVGSTAAFAIIGAISGASKDGDSKDGDATRHRVSGAALQAEGLEGLRAMVLRH
jgi:hypothetical protein